MSNKIKVGAKVKVISYHVQTPVNTITEIHSLYPNNPANFSLKSNPSYWVSEADVEFLPLTKEELQNSLVESDEKIAELNNEKEAIKLKIAFLDETGVTEFDETEYKVYKTLQTVNSAASDLDKAKLIASLIKG